MHQWESRVRWSSLQVQGHDNDSNCSGSGSSSSSFRVNTSSTARARTSCQKLKGVSAVTCLLVSVPCARSSSVSNHNSNRSGLRRCGCYGGCHNGNDR